MKTFRVAFLAGIIPFVSEALKLNTAPTGAAPTDALPTGED